MGHPIQKLSRNQSSFKSKSKSRPERHEPKGARWDLDPLGRTKCIILSSLNSTTIPYGKETTSDLSPPTLPAPLAWQTEMASTLHALSAVATRHTCLNAASRGGQVAGTGPKHKGHSCNQLSPDEDISRQRRGLSDNQSSKRQQRQCTAMTPHSGARCKPNRTYCTCSVL